MKPQITRVQVYVEYRKFSFSISLAVAKGLHSECSNWFKLKAFSLLYAFQKIGDRMSSTNNVKIWSVSLDISKEYCKIPSNSNFIQNYLLKILYYFIVQHTQGNVKNTQYGSQFALSANYKCGYTNLTCERFMSALRVCFILTVLVAYV
jgi:hypothetical protein